MEYIHKLPSILSVLMAIMVGIISFKYNVTVQEIYIRMGIGILVFYALGVYIRYSLLKVVEEAEKKKKQEQLEKQAELKAQADLMNSEKNHTVSYTVDDYGEDFTPLKISEVIQSNLRE